MMREYSKAMLSGGQARPGPIAFSDSAGHRPDIEMKASIGAGTDPESAMKRTY